MKERRVMFVDDEESILGSLKRLFLDENYDILTAFSGEKALEELNGKEIPVIVSDHRMAGMNGVEFLARVKEVSPHTIGILLTGTADLQTAVDAINSGAVYRYLAKPWNDDECRIVVREALNKYDLAQENRRLARKIKKQNKLLYDLNQNLQRAQELLSISFQRYMSEHLVREILASSQPVSLSGERKDVTVLISDIRGFTPLSENMKTEDLVNFLNQFFEAMIKIVLDNGGLVDKYMGDSLLVLFGAIYSHDDDPMRAVRTAIEMQDAVEKLNAEWAKNGEPQIKIGVGISTGEVIVGNIGSEQRLEFTGIGPDVNYAQRIEALTKTIPARILVNESTYLRVKDEVHATRFGPCEIKGKKEPIVVYGIDGIRE